MKKSILVVDKDPFILMAFKRILHKEKINVLSAYNIEQVIQKYKKSKPMLALFDLDYKNMNTGGITQIKKLYPNIPVMAITAFSNTITTKMAIEMGADVYMIKPFNIPEMLQYIKSLLEQKKPDKIKRQS